MNKTNQPDMSISETIISNLKRTKDAAGEVPNNSATPLEIPDFNILVYAAEKLKSSPTVVDDMYVIHSLCGRASEVGNDIPQAPLVFPADHSFHSKMGKEWYWVGINLTANDANGNPGQIGLMLTIQKIRSVGNDVQLEAGWSDKDVMLFASLATVTLDFDGQKKLVRRRDNKHWGIVDQDISYNEPGEPLNIRCGPDKYQGTVDVLPLNIVIDDTDNIKLDITLRPQDSIEVPNALFLQGFPNSQGQGTGLTKIPTPGFYYNWPQLLVDSNSNISVEGQQYTITDGRGWVGHQMIMSSLKNADDAIKPIPFVDEPAPYNGWAWQFFNTNDGGALTFCSIISGNIEQENLVPYGYKVSLNAAGNGWDSNYVIGACQFDHFTKLEVPGIPQQPETFNIDIPLERKYDLYQYIPGIEQGNLASITKEQLQGLLPITSCFAKAWIPVGTFCNPDWSVSSENAATLYHDAVPIVDPEGQLYGAGYLETVGFEVAAQTRERLLAYLQTGEYPTGFPD